MQIGMYNISAVTFPGLAGERQQAGDEAGLLDELGRNYSRYHAFLASELERAGLPRPEDCVDFADYTKKWTYVHHIGNAEILLRVARARAQTGQATLSPNERFNRPLLDSAGRLASVEA